MSIFRPSRRDLLNIAALSPALALPALAASPARAQTLGAPAGANPAHFRFQLGEAVLTVVSDGHLEIPANGLGVNADPEQVKAFLESYFLSTETNYSHTNHLVIELGEAKVLVDVGSGNRFLPTAGKLMENLGAAGIDASEITHVVITHAHPDHVWGIRDDFDEAILPDAQFFIGGTERDFWLQDGLVNSVPTEMQQFVVGAVNSLNVDGAEWTVVDDEAEIAPGIRVIDTPGHTIGHMSVVVESGGKQLIALGDSMNHAWMSTVRPEWVSNFDMDGEQTVATRKRLLDMAATDRMAVLGYHFPFPGVGHIAAEGDAYRFVPALWQW
ncbi:Glyoxylase, beta-lactamase superfamily II [Mameliella alba]|uniref:MBL fold metallo-hydrolase n=1 Tax=Mameliella alba TaxID=561184 RepID=UPI00088632FA|nr:MBL fold metallo-hydrolase [Mameliella alba]OWV47222.1 MBL fold metallo-hydrolase [Mameliella alba]PTR38766.1 glyoxylase-like metal-dependent hydrolase (beta-lactamase superfamily II) [Mameliella alba]GGF69292.1 MBL fold metallo-hydrolase [Mameliella alba]SDD41797.1 Glyoxylase, beta-lactamase superfamily II [Mameliella alba]